MNSGRGRKIEAIAITAMIAISVFARIMLGMAQQAKATPEDSSRRGEGSFCLRGDTK